ncbi:MAG: 1-acyl-sn-glycerol-3-phosphate acyltransferase [Candidatus Omnitrophica bacterium]|nr:1-acyl-sn-glycerol-3-phosphate acyltransferase [Candidatus Omnitrophota bacterium]
MLYVVIRFMFLVFYKIFFRLSAAGRERIPTTGAFIIASNHASYLDPPIIGVCCPRKLSYFAKEELFYNSFFAWFIRRLQAFPVKTRSADLRSVRFALAELKASKGVLIFPEGARTWDGSLGKPLGGIGLIAAKSKAPIVPAYIQGSFKALRRGTRIIRPTKIKVYFGQPLEANDLTSEKKGVDLYRYIAQRVMQKIEELKVKYENNP